MAQELNLPDEEYRAFIKWVNQTFLRNPWHTYGYPENTADLLEDSIYLDWADRGRPGYGPGAALSESELWDEYREKGFIAQSILLEQPTMTPGEGFVWNLLEFDPATGARLSPDKIGWYITRKEDEVFPKGVPEIISIGGYDYEVVIDTETGEKVYTVVGKTAEPEDEEMTEFEREQLALWGRQAEEEKRQAKLEETRWYTQFFETQQQEMYRRQQEGQLAEERGRERMMGERQSIMQLALEREQILAELKAHPRNWIEAAMFGMGSKPYGMSQISPGWGAAPTKTPTPTGQMGVK